MTTEPVDDLPRCRLAALPTPLQACPRLSEALGGPDIFIKRDDLTGLALGGNKVRQAEFLLGDALSRRANVVIASAPEQSNFCRVLAAACAALGLSCVLVLRTSREIEWAGNALLTRLFGAQVVPLRTNDVNDTVAAQSMMEELASALESRDRRPYVVSRERAATFSSVAHIAAAQELAGQLRSLGREADYLFVTTSAGGTHSGFVLGKLLAKQTYHVIASRMRGTSEELRGPTRRVISDVVARLGLSIQVPEDEITILDGYAGRGVGDITPATLEAMELVATLEGVLLDPVYTGKTMAALIDYVRRGYIGGGHTVVFVHTGGLPLVFLYGGVMADLLRTRDVWEARNPCRSESGS